MAQPAALTPEEFYKKLNRDDKKAMQNLNEKKEINFVPTGSWVINTLIGDGTGTYKPGGLPRGHIVEIFGNESCGKTTLGISACKQVQDMGGIPVWLDFERTFHKGYANQLGLDTDPNKFAYFVPEHFEHGIRLIYQALSMKPMLIVVDSVSAMIPRAFIEGGVDEVGRIGLQAQLMSVSLNYISKFLPDADTCLLFINQLRSVIKKAAWDHGPDEETSGGKALKYYSSVRIKMKTGAIQKVAVKSRITGKEDKEPINVQVKATVVKNKIDKPYFSAPVFIRFGDGIDNISSIIELAINTNTITKKGAFLTLVVDGKTLFQTQGREQLHTLLSEQPEVMKILTAKIVFKQDEETATIAAAEETDDSTGDPDLDLMLNNASDTFVRSKTKDVPLPEDAEEADSEPEPKKKYAKRKG